MTTQLMPYRESEDGRLAEARNEIDRLRAEVASLRGDGLMPFDDERCAKCGKEFNKYFQTWVFVAERKARWWRAARMDHMQSTCGSCGSTMRRRTFEQQQRVDRK